MSLDVLVKGALLIVHSCALVYALFDFIKARRDLIRLIRLSVDGAKRIVSYMLFRMSLFRLVIFFAWFAAVLDITLTTHIEFTSLAEAYHFRDVFIPCDLFVFVVVVTMLIWERHDEIRLLRERLE